VASVGAAGEVGDRLRALVEQVGLDEGRAVVLLHLVLTRLGEPVAAAALAPWLALWPEAFATPVYYGEAEERALAGTPLAAATTAKRARLVAEWEALRNLIGEALAGTAAAEAVDLAGFTLELWTWADGAFRSRVCEGPFDLPAQADPAEADGARTLGVIPVVDFANHGGAASANARWQVDDAHEAVHLVANRRLQYARGWPWNLGGRQGVSCVSVPQMRMWLGVARPGEEVLITYGDKGSEELLHQYGFALPNNPHERLVLRAPLAGPGPELGAQLALCQRLQVPPHFAFGDDIDAEVSGALDVARTSGAGSRA